jgi:hypothetical protein
MRRVIPTNLYSDRFACAAPVKAPSAPHGEADQAADSFSRAGRQVWKGIMIFVSIFPRDLRRRGPN